MIDNIIVPDIATIITIVLVSLVISLIAFSKKVLDQGGSVLAFLICFLSGALGH